MWEEMRATRLARREARREAATWQAGNNVGGFGSGDGPLVNVTCESLAKNGSAYEYDECIAIVTEVCGADSIVPYFPFHYCTMASKNLEWLSIIVQIVLTSVLFIALGVAAESFFCPALSVISDSLKLSQNVAGVTLLALGNGAPDLFSSFSATDNDSPDLAVGGVVGAGIFITTVCVGGVAFLAPFKVTRRPFLRDVVFYIVALVFLILVLNDGVIRLWESLFLIGWYIIYVIVVVAGRKINKRLKLYYKEREARLAAAAAASGAGNVNDDSTGGEDTAPLLSEQPQTSYSAIETAPADAAAASTADSMDRLAPKTWHDQTAIVTMTGTSLVFSSNDSRPGDDKHPTGSLEAPLRPVQIKSLTTALEYASMAADGHTGRSRANTALSARSMHTAKSEDSRTGEPGEDKEPQLTPLQQLPSLLFPTLNNWKEKSVLSKVMSIINLPIIFFLAITVPVVEIVENSDDGAAGGAAEPQSPAKVSPAAAAPAPAAAAATTATDAEVGAASSAAPAKDKELPPDDDEIQAVWNRYLFTLQCFLMPVFVVFGLGLWAQPLGDSNFQAWALSLIIGAVMGTIGWFTTKFDSPPVFNWTLAYVAFVVSILWIYIIADELVAAIQALGVIFGIDEAILGLTVLAWGNSIGDFVANLTVARMGFANMAVSACFGGPMLNLLLGLGISCLYQTILTGEDYPVGLNLTLLISIVSLIGILIVCGIYIPLNGYGAGRPFGIFLLVAFAASTIINVTLTSLNCSLDGCSGSG